MRRSWTPAERRMSRVGTKSGRRAIGREQLRIRKAQWRWTCQLGSICVLKHVHLEERRSECFCFLTFYSLCSSDAPTTRASARSAQRGQTFAEHPQKRSRGSCCFYYSTALLSSSVRLCWGENYSPLAQLLFFSGSFSSNHILIQRAITLAECWLRLCLEQITSTC